MQILNRILEWLEKYLPGLIVAFGLGYKKGKSEELNLRKEILDLETKQKRLKNQNAVEKKYTNMSDADVVDSIAKRPGNKN